MHPLGGTSKQRWHWITRLLLIKRLISSDPQTRFHIIQISSLALKRGWGFIGENSGYSSDGIWSSPTASTKKRSSCLVPLAYVWNKVFIWYSTWFLQQQTLAHRNYINVDPNKGHIGFSEKNMFLVSIANAIAQLDTTHSRHQERVVIIWRTQGIKAGISPPTPWAGHRKFHRYLDIWQLAYL